MATTKRRPRSNPKPSPDIESDHNAVQLTQPDTELFQVSKGFLVYNLDNGLFKICHNFNYVNMFLASEGKKWTNFNIREQKIPIFLFY